MHDLVSLKRMGLTLNLQNVKILQHIPAKRGEARKAEKGRLRKNNVKHLVACQIGDAMLFKSMPRSDVFPKINLYKKIIKITKNI